MKKDSNFFLTTRILLSVVFLFSIISLLKGGHNTSRYFPFLERPESYTVRSKRYLTPSFFATSASSAFKRTHGKVGIPELWGPYDLKDVINSLTVVKQGMGEEFPNPFLRAPGVEGLVDCSIPFDVDGKVTSVGMILEGAYQLFTKHFYIGFSIPFLSVEARSRYLLQDKSTKDEFINPVVEKLLPGEKNQVERVRLEVHEELGLEPFDWEHEGFGDLDLYLRWNAYWDHFLMMKTINFNIIGGVLFPTSVMMDNDNPASVPFMGNSHVGFYIDGLLELELKYDLKVGAYTSFMFQAPSTRMRRMAIFSEPNIFSALKGEMKVTRGNTFKFSPYITFENILDGLHLHGRYTYLRHSNDSYQDKREDQSIESYLTKMPTEDISQNDIDENIKAKEKLSSWRTHYISVQLSYEPKADLKKWVLDPVFYVMIDTPYSGSGISKTHQISAGISLRF